MFSPKVTYTSFKSSRTQKLRAVWRWPSREQGGQGRYGRVGKKAEKGGMSE